MARDRRITLRHRMEYAAVRAAQAAICLMPAALARAAGAFLGDVAFSVFRVRRRVVMKHLRRIFGGETSEEELVAIARESYRNFGRMTFEYGRFPMLRLRDVERVVKLTGGAHLDDALAKGGGAILVASHFGNWELAATLATMGYPLTFLVGEQHNILVDRLMNRLRERFGVQTVPVTGNLMGVLRALRNNRIVAMLSDQDAGRSGVFVDFLGEKASTPYGPARMSARTGAPLIPGVAVREERGRHELIICPPVERPPADLPAEEQVRLLTQGYTSVFERFIRERPDHYFWMHRRWKTRPSEEATPADSRRTGPGPSTTTSAIR
ncbi:MAG: lysophospholipid acyltransferase family protein [Candidatus Eisenbacteria bacterium]|nr:lysophospholipid acyltransferase family protein [Candidatus Eisenbacteria bacterium]